MAESHGTGKNDSIKIQDIVDKKAFKANGNTVEIDVPCGLFRFIDIELKEPLKTEI